MPRVVIAFAVAASLLATAPFLSWWIRVQVSSETLADGEPVTRATWSEAGDVPGGVELLLPLLAVALLLAAALVARGRLPRPPAVVAAGICAAAGGWVAVATFTEDSTRTDAGPWLALLGAAVGAMACAETARAGPGPTAGRRDVIVAVGAVATAATLLLPWAAIAGFPITGFGALYGADVAIVALATATALGAPPALPLLAAAVAAYAGTGGDENAVGAFAAVAVALATAVAAGWRRAERRFALNLLVLGAALVVLAACALLELPDWVEMSFLARGLPEPLALLAAGLAVSATGEVLTLRRRRRGRRARAG